MHHFFSFYFFKIHAILYLTTTDITCKKKGALMSPQISDRTAREILVIQTSPEFVKALDKAGRVHMGVSYHGAENGTAKYTVSLAGIDTFYIKDVIGAHDFTWSKKMRFWHRDFSFPC